METFSAEIIAEAIDLAGEASIIPDKKLGDAFISLAQKLSQAQAEGRKLRVKFGVDPTSADLHLGHTVGLRALKRFQDRGHEVILIIGGFTAQLGDPTGRNASRPPLTAEQVADNARTYLEQVKLVLDLDRVRVVNNADWLGQVDLIKLASMVTVNQLLAKEAFGTRLEKQQPLGLHELIYPLLQGFDSVKVEADIEIGGQDQTFNILMGRQLQPNFGQTPQIAMLMPLLVGLDGTRKMSKSFGNSVGLTDTPDDMFAKLMSIADPLIMPFFRLVSAADNSTIEAMQQSLDQGSNPKLAKEKLAHTIVTQFHSAAAADEAQASWARVHSARLIPDVMPELKVTAPTPVVDLLKDSGLAPSKNKARQLIEGGGVRLDGEKIVDINLVLPVPPQAGLVLQVGRRQFIRLIP